MEKYEASLLNEEPDDHKDGCPDSCIKDKRWECDCYSHNPPSDGEGHSKNPAALGMTHKQYVAFLEAQE